MIGFSQLCENPILDESVMTTEGNQYFQLALSLEAANLMGQEPSLLDCNSAIEYTMFLPGNSVPSASVAQLSGLPDDLINYLTYYIHPGNITLTPGFNISLQMLDGNEADFNVPNNTMNNPTINNVEIIDEICTCNGVIYIIDELIWAPGVMNTNIHTSPTPFVSYNSLKNQFNIYNYKDQGTLTIKDLSGRTLFKKVIKNNLPVSGCNYKTGIYLVEFKSRDNKFESLIFIK